MTMEEETGRIQVRGGGLRVTVVLAPFDFGVFRESDDACLLKTAARGRWRGFAPIAFTRDHGFTWNRFYWGYRGLREP